MIRKAVLLAILAGPVFAHAASADPTERLTRAMQQSERVIVGQVAAVEASWKVNAHGDQLIVSRAWVRTEEALKGASTSDVPVEIEGGTLDGMTLKVSDMPVLRPGDRAVFMLKKAVDGEWVPHDRGAGVLRVEKDEQIQAAGMNLNQVRELARRMRARGVAR